MSIVNWPPNRRTYFSSLAISCLAFIGMSALGETLNVRDFGAKGDGQTNDTAAFQRALASADSEVHIPPGTYLLGPAPLTVSKGTTITGAGSATLLRVAKDSTSVFILSDDDQIRNLSIEGTNARKGEANDLGILYAPNCKKVLIDAIEIANADRPCVLGDHVEGLVVSNCDFHHVGQAMNIAFSNHVRITGNNVSEPRTNGIEIWGGTAAWKIKGSSYVIVNNNFIYNSGGGAIFGVGLVQAIFSNNIVDGAEDVGVDMEWCDDSMIVGNTVRRGRNSGISLFFGCKGIAITGNAIYNDLPITPKIAAEDAKAKFWVRAGIWLTYPNRTTYPDDHGHRDVTITGNSIFCAEGDRRGIWIGSESDNVVLSGNAIHGGGVWYGGVNGLVPVTLSPLASSTIITQPFSASPSAH